MPKISATRATQNRLAIEAAALRCFVRRGYNGVSVRELADAAEVSLGNLYTYFPDKRSLFRGVLARLADEFVHDDNPFVAYLRRSDFPHDLPKMGLAIAQNVERYRDFLKLMYVDVVEFDGAHIGELFSNLDTKFQAVLGPRFKKIGGLGPRGELDPAFAFVAIYMGFYQYFVLTRLFGARATYGERDDKELIADLSTLFLHGVAPRRRRT